MNLRPKNKVKRITVDYKLSKKEETLNRIGVMRETKSKLHLSENKRNIKKTGRKDRERACLDTSQADELQKQTEYIKQRK